MIRALHWSTSRILILSCCLLLASLSRTSAQLPYSQSFKTNSAPGLVIGGSPTAYLTAGSIDPATDGYLRLTSNSTGSGGYAYNNTSFPAAFGLKVSFEYFAYNGTSPPADGFSFFLFDAATTSFNIGSYGGALGYNTNGSVPGVSNGYLGIGLDVYGNFTGAGANRVGVRGPGNGYSGYSLLTYSNVVSPAIYSGVREPNPAGSGYRKVVIELSPKAVTGGYSYDITVKIVSGNGATNTVINNFTGFSTAAPANLKYGFAGSTGSLAEVHEIRNLNVDAYNVPTAKPTANNDAATLSCSAASAIISVLNNDAPANTPLAFDSTSVRLINPANPNDTGNSYTIAGVGTFSSSNAYGSQGKVTFTPAYLFAGTATIQYVVKDNYGLGSNAATITVDGSTRISTYAVSQSNVACNGGNDGAVTINGSTNPAGYTYAQGSGAYGTSGSFTGLTAGSYTFHTMNASGCVKDTAIIISQPAAPTVTLSSSNICGSGSSNVVFTGTPNATVTYHVDNGANQTIVLSGSGTATIGTSPTVTTTYTATGIVTPATCTATLSGAGATTTVAVNPMPQGSITANGPFNSSGAGQLIFTSTAGTGPFTVIYNDGTANRTATGVVSGTPFSTNPATVNTTTTYTLVSVADANCTRTTGFTGGTATITVMPYNALAFDGTNDYVNVNYDLNHSSQTLEAWIKPLSASRMYVISNDQPSQFGAGFGVSNYALEIDCHNQFINVPGTLFSSGTWAHVAVVYESTGRVRAYVNGTEVYNAIPNATWMSSMNGYTNYLIGKHNPTTTLQFNGSIDEVRVWNRSLCQAEIQNNINGFLPNPAAQNGLVSYFKFDQGAAAGNNTSITTATDASNSGINGTLNNFDLTAGNSTSNFVAGAPAVTSAVPAFVPPAPATPTVTTAGGATAFCAGSSLTLTTPSVTGYTYQWNNGGTAISGATANTYNATAAGSYTVTITTDCGASATSAATVLTLNPLPQGSLTANGPFCGSGSGQLTFTSTAGAAPFTIIYNDGTANRTATNVMSGTAFAPFTSNVTATTTYILVSIQGVNCTRTTGFTGGTATITVNPVPNAVATPSSQNICNSNAITAIALTGSVAGTTYSWTRDNTASVTGIAASGSGNISGSLTNTTSTIQTATFTITPTAAGCTGSTTTATVTVNPTPDVTQPGNLAACAGAVTNAVAFTGSVAGTTYSWTNSTPSIGLAASGTGNIPSFTATNASPTPVVATITVTPSIPNGTPVSGSQTFNYTGAAQAWTVPAGVTSVQVSAFGAQSGGLTCSTAGGLGGSASGTLAVSPGDVLYINVGQQGQQTNAANAGYSSAAFNGGGKGWTWNSNYGYAAGGGGASDVRLGGNALTNRKIVAGGAGGSTCNGCVGGVGGGLSGGADGCGSTTGGTQSAGGTGGVPGALGSGGDANSATTVGWVGGGGGGYYGGASGTSHNSGSGGSSYIGGVTGGTTTSGVRSGDGLVTISYTVSPTCTGTPVTFTITANPLPVTQTVTGGGNYCAGGAGVTVGLSSSQSGVNYQLLVNGSNTGSPVAGTGSAMPNAFPNQTVAGTYTVVAASTAGGCMATMAGSATVGIYPAATATISGTTGICSGNGPVTVTFNGSPNATVTYNTNGGADQTIALGSTGSNSISVSPAATAIYTATSVSSSLGCISALTGQSATVTVYNLPVVSIASTTNPACNGQSNGSITTTTTGGTPTYSYLWTPGNVGTPNLSNVPAGMYSVTVTDLNGCTAAASATLTQPAVLAGAMTGSFAVPSCPAYNIYLGYGAQYDTLSAPFSGGTAPYTYAWSGTGTSFQTTRRSVMPAATTTYTATVTDGHGCVANASYQVKVLDVHCGPAYVGRERNNTVMMCRANAYACVSPTQAAVYINAGDCLGPCAGAARQANPANASHAFTGTISVYPNPAHSTVNVQLTGIGSSYKAYQVVDITGKLIAQQVLEEGSAAGNVDVIAVNVSNYVPGVYLIRVTGGDNTGAVARFVVE